MLGIGGAAAAAQPSFMFANVPLLGTGENIVFDVGVRPLLAPRATAWYMMPEVRGPEWSNQGRNPGKVGLRSPYRHTQQFARNGSIKGGGRPWSPFGEPYTYQTKPFPDDDPMIAFFMAAEDLREKIGEDVRTSDASMWNLVTVTCVDAPIMAMPREKKGFFLETQITQFTCKKGGIVNLDQALSTSGDIPIETPNAVEMKFMLLLQEELALMGFLNQRDIRRQAIEDARRRVRQKGLWIVS
mgnify:CR=1 FL=1